MGMSQSAHRTWCSFSPFPALGEDELLYVCHVKTSLLVTAWVLWAISVYLHIAREDVKYLFWGSVQLFYSLLSVVWGNWFGKTLQTSVSQGRRCSRKETQNTKVVFYVKLHRGFLLWVYHIKWHLIYGEDRRAGFHMRAFCLTGNSEGCKEVGPTVWKEIHSLSSSVGFTWTEWTELSLRNVFSDPDVSWELQQRRTWQWLGGDIGNHCTDLVVHFLWCPYPTVMGCIRCFRWTCKER